MFKVGDLVTWTSQSSGVVRTKKGEVVEVIPPGGRPNIQGAGSPRKHESYVVDAACVDVTKNKRWRKYWPIVSKLTLVKDEV